MPPICLDVRGVVNKNASVTRKYTVNPERRRAMDKRRLSMLKRYRQLVRRFPPDGRGAMTALAAEMGLSRERVRQLVREGEDLEDQKRAG